MLNDLLFFSVVVYTIKVVYERIKMQFTVPFPLMDYYYSFFSDIFILTIITTANFFLNHYIWGIIFALFTLYQVLFLFTLNKKIKETFDILKLNNIIEQRLKKKESNE
jgi:hypothetical protein